MSSRDPEQMLAIAEKLPEQLELVVHTRTPFKPSGGAAGSDAKTMETSEHDSSNTLQGRSRGLSLDPVMEMYQTTNLAKWLLLGAVVLAGTYCVPRKSAYIAGVLFFVAHLSAQNAHSLAHCFPRRQVLSAYIGVLLASV